MPAVLIEIHYAPEKWLCGMWGGVDEIKTTQRTVPCAQTRTRLVVKYTVTGSPGLNRPHMFYFFTVLEVHIPSYTAKEWKPPQQTLLASAKTYITPFYGTCTESDFPFPYPAFTTNSSRIFHTSHKPLLFLAHTKVITFRASGTGFPQPVYTEPHLTLLSTIPLRPRTWPLSQAWLLPTGSLLFFSYPLQFKLLRLKNTTHNGVRDPRSVQLAFASHLLCVMIYVQMTSLSFAS